MGNKDDFLEKLLLTFKIEAEEHINAVSAGLINLEKGLATETEKDLIEVMLREVHSLKGAARSVNVTEIETICQSLESVFAALQHQKLTLSAQLFDLFHQAVENLSNFLTTIGTKQNPSRKLKTTILTRTLDDLLKSDSFPPSQEKIKKTLNSKEESLPPEKFHQTGTVRISTQKLDSLLLQAEEMLSLKLTANQRAFELNEIKVVLDSLKKEWMKIQFEIRGMQQLIERKDKDSEPNNSNAKLTMLLEFIEWNSTAIRLLDHKLITLLRFTEEDKHSVGRMVDTLLRDMKRVVMLPISSILEVFPRLIRELSRDQGKDIDLVIDGEETEADRRILEEIKDPLIHLVRNCIDHGIEQPFERELKEKKNRGTITISISPQNDNNIEILITDDGRGIDVTKVIQMALKLGVVSAEELENLTEEEELSFIFHSGVSTSPIITDISGRGLGLAIVKEKIEKLGGGIFVKNNLHTGSTFRILLPVTLATFRGTVVKVSEHFFVVPTRNVERVTRINKEDIKTVKNKETIQLNGQTISLARLSNILELPQKIENREDSKFIFVLILGNAEKLVAFSVDEIINEQEVLVKNLGKQLLRVRNIAGATVLGTGKIVPILHVVDLIKSAMKLTSILGTSIIVPREIEAKRKSILVVEDSITARVLVKNILESAGYDVKTAIDGIDALTTLKTNAFDLVVSDIEMPRMNGLNLTMKIRADKKLSNLPIVLVTALEKREDREQGIDVGANAYIVKSSFDQSNLLEVVRRLI